MTREILLVETRWRRSPDGTPTFEEEISEMFDRKLLALGALAGVAYGLFEVAGVVIGGTSNPVQFDIFPSAATATRAAATAMPVGVWVGFAMEVLATLFLLAFVVRASAA